MMAIELNGMEFDEIDFLITGQAVEARSAGASDPAAYSVGAFAYLLDRLVFGDADAQAWAKENVLKLIAVGIDKESENG